MGPHNTRCGNSARAKRARNRCDDGCSCCDARHNHRAEDCSTVGFHGRRSWSCDDFFILKVRVLLHDHNSFGSDAVVFLFLAATSMSCVDLSSSLCGRVSVKF